MKIINIAPGFGGTFYCGNCLRDRVYSQTLKTMGHQAVSVPIYLPLSIEEYDADNGIPVFYGAVNIYLKQKFRWMQNMPKWLENFFNSSALLKFAAKKSGSTRADGLEEMTISMLNGDEGFQEKELDQLIDFLRVHEQPDIVHLSNALLMGMAKKIKQELNIPVVCSLQDEDVWIDAMRPAYQQKLWDIMAEKAKNIDAFVAVSDYFRNVMQEKMRIPDEKLFTVHIGVDPDAYKVNEPNTDTPTIGYLSRIYKENGIGVLVDAFIHLKENSKFTNAKLRISGGLTGDDKRFVNKQIRKLKRKGFYNDVEFVEDFRIEALDKFFNGLSLLSVPVLKGEAFGPYLLESMASGIPIVQPALGAFPEMVMNSGGGAVYEPNEPQILAEKMEELLSAPDELKNMSRHGRKAVEERFSNKILTEKMAKVYEEVIERLQAKQKLA